MTIRPEDILPNNDNTVILNGTTVRKGTIAATFANAEILLSTSATLEEKVLAKAMIEEFAPHLVALGMHKHVTWKNPEIQMIIERFIK